MDIKSLMTRGAVIVDVRTAAEFSGGNIQGSQNIPVDAIRNKVPELKALGVPVITVCKSGGRSSLAASMLTAAGIEAYNAGPWNLLQQRL
jgi:rhodanese-related sulfurtransferase